jgi:solute carrier family 13 (sodium-dependent dicarboxylate transporter), member 2/3/5
MSQQLEAPSNEKEEKKIKQGKLLHVVYLVAGPLSYLACTLVSPLPDVSETGMRTLGIFLWTIIWWMTEPVPIAVTSLMTMALLVITGVQTLVVAFSSWANWIIIFLLAACIIGHALGVHGVSRRIAYKLVASRLVDGKPWRVILLFGIGAAAMSSVMSHVVTTLIFIKLAEGLAETFELKPKTPYTECLFLAIAWGSNLGILTPVGTPPNLIAIDMIRKSGYPMGFFEWIMACAPAFLVAVVGMFIAMKYVLRPKMPDWANSRAFLQQKVIDLGPMTVGGKVASVVFVSALVIWMLPDFVPLLLFGGNRQHPVSLWLTSHLDWSVSAVLISTTLFMIPISWDKDGPTFVMKWKDAVEGIDWSTLALISGALAIGNAISDTKVGLGAFVQNSLSSLSTTDGSQFFFVFGVIAFTIIVGTFISNIAIIIIVGTMILKIAGVATFNPVALLVAVGMAASFDFALPFGTPPSAMVFATKQVRAKSMLKGGAPLALAGILICTFLGYYWVDWLIPWHAK